MVYVSVASRGSDLGFNVHGSTEIPWFPPRFCCNFHSCLLWGSMSNFKWQPRTVEANRIEQSSDLKQVQLDVGTEDLARAVIGQQ
jgi:hypothetical protein